jgi:sucrose-phosphate synthase
MSKVKQFYSWSSHAQTYFRHLESPIAKLPSASLYQDAVSVEMPKPHPNKTSFAFDKKILMSNRVLISDIDNTLIGDTNALNELLDYLHQAKQVSFGVATGRHLASAREILEQWEVPSPDVVITAVGTEIYYGKRFAKDKGWQQHIGFRWEPAKIRAALAEFQEFEPQPPEHQSDFKISYVAVKDHKLPLTRRPVVSRLRQQRLLATVIVTEGRLIDVLPIRASKGLAVHYLALRWGLPMDRFIVAGDSGNDEEMLKGDACGIVVGNYSPELEKLRGRPCIYFAQRHNAGGIIEGLQHFKVWEDSVKS